MGGGRGGDLLVNLPDTAVSSSVGRGRDRPATIFTSIPSVNYRREPSMVDPA